MSAVSQAMLMAAAGAGGGGIAEATAILAALKSWWTLDENAANPTYNDSHASNHLTQRNAGGNVNTSVNTTATAKHGQAWNANHTDNLTCYIPRSNTNLDAVDADFSFGGWFRGNFDLATAAFLMGRVGGTTINAQNYLYVETDGTTRFAVNHTDGSIGNRIVANSGLSISPSTYYLIFGIYDKTNGFVRIKVFESTFGLTEVNTSLAGNVIWTGASNSNFCVSEGLDNDANFFTANRGGVVMADELLYVDKALTAAEVTYLYNSGAGKSYADLVADA